MEETFTPPLLSDTWTDLWNRGTTDYADQNFDKRLVRDIVELTRAAIPIEACVWTSIYLIGIWQALDIEVERVLFDENTAGYRAMGLIGDSRFQFELERSFLEEKASTPQILDRLLTEIRNSAKRR